MAKEITSFFKHHWGIVMACLLTVFALLPLFHPGLFPMHDDEQVGRLYELHQDVLAGHIPPRLTQDLGFGYDYPLFNFYPPFIYYIGEFFVLLGFSYIISIKLVVATGFVFAAVFMYLFAREHFGEIGGVVAAVAYTYAPYHSVDVYVRGALPEFWSFAFIPAIFWSLKKLSDNGQKRNMVWTALFICLLILTHNLVAFMSAVFIALYGLYLLSVSGRKKDFLLQAIFSGVLGLLLSAYFWIPSYFEKKDTMISLLTTELADYRQHFVYLRQLWNSPWGYGGSLYGLYDGLSFQLGKVHVVLTVLSLLALVFIFRRRPKKMLVSLVFFILFVLSVFMTTFYSQPVWDAIQPLSYIQFPWRYLLFAAFFSSLLLGIPFLFKLQKKAAFGLAAVMITLTIFLSYNYFRPEKYLTTATDQDYISLKTLNWRTSVMAFEYTPRGIATKKSTVGNTVIAINQDQVAKGSYQVASGQVNGQVIIDKPQEKKIMFTSEGKSTIRLNTFSFPGWKVFLDGKEIRYNDSNKLKLITFSLPTGKHTIDARFTNTLIRTVGNVLTILGLFGVVGLLIFGNYSGWLRKRLAKAKL